MTPYLARLTVGLAALASLGCGTAAAGAPTGRLTVSGPRVIGGMVWMTAVREQPGEDQRTFVVTCPPDIDEELFRIDGVVADACRWQPLEQPTEPPRRELLRRQAQAARAAEEARLAALAASMTPTDETHRGELTDLDTVDPRSGATIDKYSVDAVEGWLIEVSMRSVFDNYLEVYFGGQRVAQNDDHEGLNARVSFRATQTGRYEIHARGLAGDARGTYELHITVRPP